MECIFRGVTCDVKLYELSNIQQFPDNIQILRSELRASLEATFGVVVLSNKFETSAILWYYHRWQNHQFSPLWILLGPDAFF